MATLLLSAVGAAIGGSFGGSVVGIASGAIGKAFGATLGAVFDQRLTGLGSETVETGRVDRFRVMGAGEGAPLPRVFGRVRVAGQIIWSSRFLDEVTSQRVGGKGGGTPSQRVREHSYSISLAVAVCEGEVVRIGRIWADGQQLALVGVGWRLHTGAEDQLPDPLIAAIEGEDTTPAYRGTSYVVFENLELAPFGNRIPQFNFEVFRRVSQVVAGLTTPPALDVRGVALVPGTGEYALATSPVHLRLGKGRTRVANVNNDRGRPDLLVSLEQLRAELPAVTSVSLVVSWFGDDLRCDRCTLQPAVEQATPDGRQSPWRVSGVRRSAAKVVSRLEDRPVFGGTPSDVSVVQAISHMNGIGHSVMFYPFILMDILGGNGLTDPWTGAGDQPRVPWRGWITLSRAPGQPASPDKTRQAADEVDAFFGQAQPSDFAVGDGGVVYFGPDEWSYRRFILHYAHLCAVAGGVDAFCIGSEMRSLTQVRDGAAAYPAVRALRALAQDVRSVLGSRVKIGYAADWSEYFGHHPSDGSGDVLFHLDPLWSDPEIDFVGIDNYMPLSDWRDGSDHADADAGSIYDLDYLIGNVAGGEGYDWYYSDADARDRQERSTISDAAYGEPWVFRYKDIASWWTESHFNRIGRVRSSDPTSWQPRSKPVWFTELGCPAVDKGTNQPNVFYDPKSAESFFPYYSSGARDDFVQQRYLQAVYAYWKDVANNPASGVFGGRMVDLEKAHVWAWDARPWPDFPDRLDTWIDGANYARGHWINTRLGLPTLADVVAETCVRAGVADPDVSLLSGCVTGYTIAEVETARQSLQPLMLVYGFDSFTNEGRVAFGARSGRVVAAIAEDALAVAGDGPALVSIRSAPTESPGQVVLGFVQGDSDYLAGAAEAVSPENAEPDAAQSSVPIVLSDGEARAVAERWLSEARVARDSAEFSLPLSGLGLTAGDVVSLGAGGRQDLFRIDRVEELGRRSVSAVRIEPSLYRAPVYAALPGRSRALAAVSPVYADFLDLPLLTGEEVPHAPYIAVTKTPWAGSVAVFSAANDFGYALNREVLRPATMGETIAPLEASDPGAWSRASLSVRLASGALQSVGAGDVLNGANVAALRFDSTGDWEVLQFETAELQGPNVYRLSGLLRGQAGTDGIMPPIWPAGSDFVLLNGAPVQLEQPQSARGQMRHFRIGPAAAPYDDASYEHAVLSFAGVGLRPYRPAHLGARPRTDGDIDIAWVRRTRVDGDSWEGLDAPLGEERELYHLVIRKGGAIVREFYPARGAEVYSVEMQLSDDISPEFSIEVAQISDRFGPGPYLSKQIDLR